MVDDPRLLPTTKHRVEVLAPRTGWIQGCNPRALAWVAVEMGAGRTRADQAIDPAVGIELVRVVGERVTKGEPIAQLHVHRASDAKPLMDRVSQAFRIGTKKPPERPLVLERIDGQRPRRAKRSGQTR